MSDIIEARRESVIQAYNCAKAENYLKFLEGDEKATSEYIYENQIFDANNIVNEFFENNRRVISITKKTKVGMDGLMIEVAKLMTTHHDDNFVVNPASVRIITGMSNAGWEKDMKEKSPNCFKHKIFHHGQLKNAELNELTNALIIIDEIDTGDQEYQRLHMMLKDAGVLNITHMVDNNNRFLFASATMIRELYDLYQWGDLHFLYKMTIPPNYIGHIDFLNMGIIQEFYSLVFPENANKWIDDDIIGNYNDDFRVHIARVNNKSVIILQNACIRKGIKFLNHTSEDRLSEKEIKELFKDILVNHIVIGVKGFFRRANLIPNKWKLRIGATHEFYTKLVDNNVQIQGLSGRMTGYWRDDIESGHKTGPHRTSICAIQEYELIFNDPFGANDYITSGLRKKKGKVSRSRLTMISPQHIGDLIAVGLPSIAVMGAIHECAKPISIIVYDSNIDKIENVRDIELIKHIVNKYNPLIFEEYQNYEWHCWNANTETKLTKWGITRMNEADAYSSEVNITPENKKKDIIMVYLINSNNELILSPWNGAKTN
jgi:hypothetical protein